MRTFPQEIVDMVVDQLADSLWRFREPVNISHYSTVSRQWLDRTQKHHFGSVHIRDQLGLGEWRTNIAPDPCGVSRHVRELSWWCVKTLEGFDDHIRAFTHVENIMLIGCHILLWPSVVRSLAPLGSSLVSLRIDQATTTYDIVIPLLAALPHLRHLCAHSLRVLGDCDVAGLPSRVPFFEDAGCLGLVLDGDAPGSLDWIPPSARFRELRIDVLSILDNSGRVKQWVASSAGTLRFLSITEYPGGPSFSPLDLSGCTELESLQLMISLPQPGVPADTVLPSLHSFPPPKVVLAVDAWFEQVDFQAWEVMVGHLHRAAKRFKTTHTGKKMEVEISLGGWDGDSKPGLVEWCKSGEVILKLMEDANVVVTGEEDWGML